MIQWLKDGRPWKYAMPHFYKAMAKAQKEEFGPANEMIAEALIKLSDKFHKGAKEGDEDALAHARWFFEKTQQMEEAEGWGPMDSLVTEVYNYATDEGIWLGPPGFAVK